MTHKSINRFCSDAQVAEDISDVYSSILNAQKLEPGSVDAKTMEEMKSYATAALMLLEDVQENEYMSTNVRISTISQTNMSLSTSQNGYAATG